MAGLDRPAERLFVHESDHEHLAAGVVLHQSALAELATGEGKTLVATLPAYLNGLTGLGMHIVTVNDYLAKR
ncbi:MAG: hypothetical protein K6T59_16525, partial [Bryobacteraceae bacterium]|nr:hypothetical protein [Bryobacteraceae bacterium]